MNCDQPAFRRFGRFFRGASVSNVPFVRPTRFASNVVGGDVPAGWEVELYRGEQLLDRGMVGPDGEIEFRAPTQFGFNPYRLLAYGPNGQRAELDRAFFVFNERLPAGQFEYSLGGGECRYALCEATANVDLRWGVSDRLTVRGGAVSLWYDSIPDRQALYGSATVQPTRALSLTGNLVEGTLGEAVVRVYPSRDLQIDGGYTYLQAGSPDPRRYRESDAEIVRGSITYRPRALGYLTTFRAFGSLEDRGAATRRGWGASVASQIARVRVDLGGQRTSLDPASAGRRVVHRGYAQSSVQLRRGSRGLLAGSILRGGVTAVERRGLESAFVRFSQPFGRQWRVAAQVGWDEFRGTSLRIDVKANLRGLRWNSRNEVLEGGAQGVQTLQGSVLLGAAARPISLADGYAVGRAGVTGVAFQDLDGDGRRDQGEPAISGVRVRLQGRLETTDLSGAFSVWDLAPFEEVRLRVDPTAGPDLQWTPLHEVYQVFPEPNRFTQVDMGVAPGDYRIRILQPGLPDDAGGVDAGVLEVRSGESGVLDGIVLTIGAGDLDRLEEELSDYLDSDRIQQAFGELDPDELRRAVVGRQLRAGGGSESVRWVPLDRGAAPAATEPTRTTAGAGGG